MYRTLPGLENVKIVRDAYAIEYDCINADVYKRQILYSTLFLAFRQCKKIYKNALFTFFNHNYTKLPTCYSHIVDNFLICLLYTSLAEVKLPV